MAETFYGIELDLRDEDIPTAMAKVNAATVLLRLLVLGLAGFRY